MITFILALASAVAIGPRPLAAMTVGEDDYPKAALRLGREARVVFHLKVDTDGVPHNCTIPEPGDAELDAQTCELALARLRFAPGHSSAGVAVEVETIGAVRWSINAHTPLNDLTDIVTMTLAGDGTIEKCAGQSNGVDKILPITDCRRNIGNHIFQLTGDDPASDATITLVTTRQVGSLVAPSMAQLGKLRTSLGVVWTVNPNGSVSDCVVVENNVNGRAIDDPCSSFEELLSAPYEAVEAGKLRNVSFGTYVLVQPRVPDADEPRP
ncbi:energy transducer TonB [Glacieibacterium megasporae]|uniref:energy transducer TonB n=1 Tax=Glacieibacterium megasporae TaxID=2835787 RepID=UPI001C1E24BF|nr:energy transducer TonB [Polymorphobacter megasporae]UAJ09006.1 energy transducer TonB [Polymorphobacter megasporae]